MTVNDVPGWLKDPQNLRDAPSRGAGGAAAPPDFGSSEGAAGRRRRAALLCAPPDFYTLAHTW